MPTDFNDLAYFGITNVQMNGKCWNQGVTFSSRTIFHFEQCAPQSATVLGRLFLDKHKSEYCYEVTHRKQSKGEKM